MTECGSYKERNSQNLNQEVKEKFFYQSMANINYNLGNSHYLNKYNNHGNRNMFRDTLCFFENNHQNNILIFFMNEQKSLLIIIWDNNYLALQASVKK